MIGFLGTGTAQQGIYSTASGSLGVVADLTTAQPGTGNPFLSFDQHPKLFGTTAVFWALGTTRAGIYSNAGGPLGVVVDTTTTVPGGSGTFKLFYWVSGISANGVVFSALDSSFNLGVYSTAGGSLDVVANTSTPVPGGFGSTFSGFGFSPALDGNHAAFSGSSLFSRSGIYSNAGGSLNRIADITTPFQGLYPAFLGEPVAVAGDNVAFYSAFISGSGSLLTGIYVSFDGSTAVPLVGSGNILDGRVVSSVGMSSTAFDGDNLAFSATFEDGGSGIYIATVTEPSPATNDGFADATDLGNAAATSVTGTNFDATAEAGEQDVRGGRTVWWKWLAPSNGVAVVDTFGSFFDTILGVYTGASVDSLTRVRECDDAAGDHTSRTRFVATSGMTYHFRVESTSPTLMGPISLNLSTIEVPATASEHVTWGRARLEEQTMAGLTGANTHFTSAVTLDPAHEEALLLRAMTRLLLLETESVFETLLMDLGVIDSDLYTGNYQVPKDAQGDPIVQPGSSTSDIVDYLDDELLPELVSAQADLALIGNTFTTSFSDCESTDLFFKTDFGSVQLLLAGTYAAEAMIHLLVTLDTAASLEDVSNLHKQGKLDAQNVLSAFSGLLQFTATDRRSMIKTAIQNLTNAYEAGTTHVLTVRSSPSDTDFLFNIGSAISAAGEADLSAALQNISDSLDGQILWESEPVDLSMLLTTGASPRMLLPNLCLDQAIANTTPDPSLQGALPAGTQTKINDFLDKHGLLVNLSTYPLWAEKFLSGVPLIDQLKTADPDRDQLTNCFEFIFGLDPLSPASRGEHIGSATRFIDPGTSKQHLMITFVRRIDTTNLSYIVAVGDYDEMTHSIVWDQSGIQVEQVGTAVPTGNGITEQVTFRIKNDVTLADKKFLRVIGVETVP